MLGLAGGLAALAHPQAAVYLATSLVVFLPWAANWRHAVTRVAVSGVIGLAVLATWLVPVVAVHGLDPLVSGIRSGKSGPEGLAQLFALRFTDLIVFDLITIAAVAGLVLAVRQRGAQEQHRGPERRVEPGGIRRRRALNAPDLARRDLGRGQSRWVCVCDGPSCDARRQCSARPNRDMAPRRRCASVRPHQEVPARGGANDRCNRWAGLRELRVRLAHIVASACLERSTEAGDRMGGGNTPEDAVLAVVTGGDYWEVDAVSEWFPAIADRRSAATVQGHEWLGGAGGRLSKTRIRVCRHAPMTSCHAFSPGQNITSSP